MTATIIRRCAPIDQISPEARDFWEGQDITGMTARQLNAGYLRYAEILARVCAPRTPAELEEEARFASRDETTEWSLARSRAFDLWIDAEQRRLDRNRRRREARAAARR